MISDADGLGDVLIGAYLNCDGPGVRGGAAYLITGSASPPSTTLASADAEYTGEADSDEAGYSVAGAGDVNDDGYDDMLFGAPLNDEGAGSGARAAYLIPGSAAPGSLGLASATAEFTGEVASDAAACSVAGTGSTAGATYLVLGGK